MMSSMHDPLPPEALLAGYPDEIRQTAEVLRALVRRTVPEAIERVRPGWRLIGYDLPVGRGTRFCLWVWPQFEHVHLGFERGMLMEDPERRLEGRGITKRARWLTYTPGERVDAAAATILILECVRIARLSAAEQGFLRLEREAAPAD